MHDAALVVSIFVVVMLLYSRWKIGRLRNQVTQLRGRMVQLEARRRGSWHGAPGKPRRSGVTEDAE